MSKPVRHVKLVVVGNYFPLLLFDLFFCFFLGDGATGKTCLVESWAENRFPVDYVPTVFENFQTAVCVDNHLIQLAIWDTAGQEEYKRIRTLSYPETDVFLVCFSTVSKASLENVSRQWFPELSHYCPEGMRVLVGTKTDLRDQAKKEDIVTYEEGMKMAESLGMKYVECSALMQEGLKDVFETAIRLVVSPPPKKQEGDDDEAVQNKKYRQSKKCSIL